MGFPLAYDTIAKRIDHSLLAPTLGGVELEEGCRLAGRYGVASVCIKPYAVRLAARILHDTGVAVGTTVGFPHGGHSTSVKLAEARQALAEGAHELDMVVNVGQVLSGEWDAVAAEIDSIARAAHAERAILKVIFENCYLSDDQKVRLCKICGETGADYVKTSTGYGTGGATVDDLRLMRRAAPAHVKLKAAGGLRTLDSVIEAVELGCDRIGASRTAEILDDLKARLSRATSGEPA
jgi:deoxyribose-phosphate aldolase